MLTKLYRVLAGKSNSRLQDKPLPGQVIRSVAGIFTVLCSVASYGIGIGIDTTAATMPDPNLRTCVEDHATDNFWSLTLEVEFLDCSGLGITDTTGLDQFFNLEELDISDNAITDANLVDLSSFPLLTDLDLSFNLLSSNVSLDGNTALELLNLSFNQLPAVSLSNNTELVFLDLSYNQIPSVSLSTNVDLAFVTMESNQLGSLDISNNSQLFSLNLKYNQLPSLSTSNNTNLGFLYLDNNNLTGIDVSTNGFLEELYLKNNNIGAINVSGNAGLEVLDLGNFDAVDLKGVKHLPGTNHLSTIDVTNNLDLDWLGLGNNNLSSITGLSNVGNELRTLDLRNNQLTTIPGLSSLLGLIYLNIGSNDLAGSLSFSNHSALEYLWVYDNELTAVTLPTANTLKEFGAWQNAISSLAVSHLTGLKKLWAGNNNLTALDVTANTLLETLSIYGNQLSLQTIDLTHNTKLEFLDLSNTNLHTLTISHLGDLEFLYLTNNHLNGITLPANAQLEDFFFDNFFFNSGTNSLASGINLSTYTTLKRLALSGTGLTGTLALGNLSGLKQLWLNNNSLTGVTLSSSAPLEQISLSGNTFAATALDLNAYTSLYYVDVTNMGLDSLTVSALSNLQTLHAGGNDLTSLSLHASAPLENLTLWDNSLGANAPDVSVYTGLKYLDMTGTGISSINVSPLVNLERMWLGENNLSSFSFPPAPLKSFSLGNNPLSLGNVDLNSFSALDHVDLTSTGVTGISVNNLTSLATLNLGGNSIPSIVLPNTTTLKNFSFWDNQLASGTVDVSNNTGLEWLDLTNTNLDSLDLSGLTQLKFLLVNDNDLTSLDVSTNTALQTLRADNNILATVNPNLTNNPNIEQVEVRNNPLDSATISSLLALNANPSVNVLFDNVGTFTPAFPGFFSDSLDTTISPENRLDKIKVTVGATGTYNFIISGTYSVISVPIGFLLLDANNVPVVNKLNTPMNNERLFQADLVGGQTYTLELDGNNFFNNQVFSYTLEVQRANLHTISGQAVDKAGEPLDNIIVRIHSLPVVLGQTTTDSNGEWSIEHHGTESTILTFFSENADRIPFIFYGGSAGGLSPGVYDTSVAGAISYTLLDTNNGDIDNLNIKIPAMQIAPKLKFNGTLDADSEDTISLQIFGYEHNFFSGRNTDAGVIAADETDIRVQALLPDKRYHIRGLFTDRDNGSFVSQTYRKVFPTFFRTGPDGSFEHFDFELPPGDFSGDPLLSSTFSSSDNQAALEDDDSFAFATLVSLNRLIEDGLSGSAPVDPYDYYVIDVKDTANFRVQVEVFGGATLGVQVFDANENSIVHETGNIGFGNPNLELDLSPGHYFIKVYSVSGYGDYDLRIDQLVKPLQVASNSGLYLFDNENLSVDAATNPVDTYTFVAPTTEKYNFGISVFGSGTVNVKLLDSNDNVINAGNDLNIFTHALTQGVTYKVQVTATSGNANYSLGIEAQSVAPAATGVLGSPGQLPL